MKFWAQPNGQIAIWEPGVSPKLDLRNTTSVHYREYLYADWDTEGQRDMTAEDALKQEIDDHAPTQIKKLVNSWPNPLPLPQSDRRFLLRLLVRTILRHPTLPQFALSASPRIRVAMILLKIARWLGRRQKTDLAYAKYGKRRVQTGMLMSLATQLDIDPVLADMEKRPLALLVPEESAPNFVLGTQPFILNPNGTSTDIRLGLVVHPRIMIGVMADEGEDFLSGLSAEAMRRINGMLIRQSDTIVLANIKDVEGAWYEIQHGQDAGSRVTISVSE